MAIDRELEVLESIRDGLLILDADRHISWVNERTLLEFDLGVERQELLGAHMSQIMPAEDVHICRSLISELRQEEGDGVRRHEGHLRSRDGRDIPVDIQITLLTDAGRFEGAVLDVRDISQRRQREQRLGVLTRLLRHDLRTRANVISGRLEMIEDDVVEEHAHHVEAIFESLQELTALSDKTLEVHRTLMDAGGQPQTVDAVELVDGVVERARSQYGAAELKRTLPERAPVEADRSLSIVFENLIENAVEHSDHASPTVEITVEGPDAVPGSWVTVSVEDDGPGIPPSEVEPLVSGWETPLQHGSGLGLWLVKWVIEGFEGEVSFEEREPRGTRVVIRLPPGG